jgi:hypothetical protein
MNKEDYDRLYKIEHPQEEEKEKYEWELLERFNWEEYTNDKLLGKKKEY